MRRRDFIALLGGTLATSSGGWPLAGRAQQSATAMVGVLAAGSPSGFWAQMFTAFRQGLADTGYSESRNMVIEARWAEDHYDRLPALAADLVEHGPAVIGAFATPAAKAAKTATTTIPVVFGTIADPVEIGLVASLNRPGGNMTGVSLLSVAVGPKLLEQLHQAVPSHPGGNLTGLFSDFPDFSTKWLQLLKEIVPGITKLVVLWDPSTPPVQHKAVAAAAQPLNIKTEVLELRSPSDFEAVFDAASAQRPDGLLLLSSPLVSINSKQLAELALQHRLPAISMFANFARAGGLVSYGPNLDDFYRETGIMTAKVLKGTKPADLPAERPTRFEFILNAKTAKSFGLVIPPTLLVTADEVIE